MEGVDGFARRGGLVLGLMVVMCAAWAGGTSPPVRLTCIGRSVPVDSRLWVARDPGGRVDIGDRETLDWYRPECGRVRGVAFGYTTDALWARVEVENGLGRAVDAQATLSVARLGRVTWWLFDGEDMLDRIESGVDVEGGVRVAGRYPALPFHLPAGDRRTVYLRVESDTAIRLALLLAAGAGSTAVADFTEYGFVGAGGAIFLMALILGMAQRNRLHVCLAATIGAFMGYYILYHGYYVWLGGPWPRWVNRNLVLALGVAGHGALLEFTCVYLRTSEAGGRMVTWLRRVSIGLGTGALVLCVLPFRWGLSAMIFCMVAGYAVGIPAGLHAARHYCGWTRWLLGAIWLLAALLLGTTYAGLYAWLPVWMEPAYSQRLFLLLFFLMAFAIVAGQRQRERRDRERALLAEQSAMAAQLQSLRYQLNPHFLYNTLTSIEALSRRAPGRIPELVRKLATYLRLRLHPSGDGMATVESELESIRAYLDIEQVRFADSLQVGYEIGADVGVCRVPEMLFQPLVENAVKHGMPPEGALEILIRVAREGGHLAIGVENTGHLGDEEGNACGCAGGVGLRNVKERLARVYGGAARFELREEAGRVAAEIRLPVEEGEG